MLKLLIVEKRIGTSGDCIWLAQTEDGTIPDRFHSMLGSYGEERFIMLEPVWNGNPDETTAYFADPSRRLEEVEAWSSDELEKHFPENVRWGAMLRMQATENPNS